MYIRESNPSDTTALNDIWLQSVRATHHFLTEANIQSLLPAVASYLTEPGHELWVLCKDSAPIGFMGLQGCAVESLFISPKHTRNGGGRLLLAHARSRAACELTVDVNEQNSGALAFYIAEGFEIVGRSSIDSEGRPYPLVHMREFTLSANASN